MVDDGHLVSRALALELGARCKLVGRVRVAGLAVVMESRVVALLLGLGGPAVCGKWLLTMTGSQIFRVCI